MTVTVERLVADIEANPAKAVAGLQTFDAFLTTVARDRSSDIDVDTAGARADISAFNMAMGMATRDREVDINVNGNSATAAFSTVAAGSQMAASSMSLAASAGQTASSAFSSVASGAGGAGSAVGGMSGAFSSASMGANVLMGTIQGLVLAFVPLVAIAIGVGSLLPGAFAAAAAGAGILYAALAPLVGLLGAIMPLLGGLVLVGGAIAAVAAPVLGGVQALGALKTETANAKDDVEAFSATAKDAGGKVRDLGGAAKGLGDASRNLGGTQAALTQGTKDLGGAQMGLAARTRALRDEQQALASALHSVAMAQRSVKAAQDALSDAPVEAAEAIEDARFSAAGAALAERRAIIALREAQKNLTNTQKSAARSAIDITRQTDEFTGKVYEVVTKTQEASEGQADTYKSTQLDIRQAMLDLAMARDANGDAQRDLNEIEKKGITNSDIMVTARQDLRDAEWSLSQARQGAANAERALSAAKKETTAAQQDFTAANIAAIPPMEDLNTNLKSADMGLGGLNTKLADSIPASTGATAATDAYNAAMGKLTPTGQKFVKFLTGEFLPAFGDIGKGIQDAMLPGVQAGLEAFMTTFDEIEEEMSIVGKMIGDMTQDFFEFWAGPKGQEDLTEMFDVLNDSIQAGLDLVKPFSRVIVELTTAASPMTTKILERMGDALDDLADWMDGSGKDKVNQFFEDAGHFAGLWVDVIKPIGGIFAAIATAAKPLAEKWLVGMASALEDISSYLNSGDGQDALTKYFEDAVPTLSVIWDIVQDITDALFNSSQGGTESAFYKFLVAIRDDLLPQIKDFFVWADKTDFMAKIVTGFGDLVKWLRKVDWTEVKEDLKDVKDFLFDVIAGIQKVKGWVETYMNFVGRFVSKVTIGLEQLKLDWKEFWHDIAMRAAKTKANIEDSWDGFKGWWKDKVTDPVKGAWENYTDFMGKKSVDSYVAVTDKWGKYKGWFAREVVIPASTKWFSFVSDLKGVNWGNIWGDMKESFAKVIFRIFEWIDKLMGKIDEVKETVADINPVNKAKEAGVGLAFDAYRGLTGNWSGGPVTDDAPSIVGENGPELFLPSGSGRIMPAVPSKEVMQSTASGIDPADLDRIIERLADKMMGNKQEITVNTTNEAHPEHVAREIAWSLR